MAISLVNGMEFGNGTNLSDVHIHHLAPKTKLKLGLILENHSKLFINQMICNFGTQSGAGPATSNLKWRKYVQNLNAVTWLSRPLQI